jgi:hypothetical protein
VTDPNTPNLYHMFVSEMSHKCGLDSWYRNSIIVHATSSTPEGPFERKEEILSFFAHEPVVVTLPNRSGYVMYKIGCADGAVTGSNGTGLVGPCTVCEDGITTDEHKCLGCDQLRACLPRCHVRRDSLRPVDSAPIEGVRAWKRPVAMEQSELRSRVACPSGAAVWRDPYVHACMGPTSPKSA